MSHTPKILVVGSLVMDLTVSANRLPAEGETVLGALFSTAPVAKALIKQYKRQDLAQM